MGDNGFAEKAGYGERPSKQSFDCHHMEVVPIQNGNHYCRGCHQQFRLIPAHEKDDAHDAARYRWLRDQEHIDIAACWFLPKDEPTDKDIDLDAAIDRARAQT